MALEVIIQNNAAGVAFVGISTLYWLNYSPYYVKKEEMQDKTLDVLYHKLGTRMKSLNTILPRSKTSTSIDT